MVRKSLLILLVLTHLAACTTGMEISTPPVRVSPKNPNQAYGLDVFAASRQRGDPAPEYRGEKLVTIRTRLNAEGPGTVEFSGARCRISSSMFTAEVTTPAQIVVPDYGRSSPVITAECRARDRKATKSISVYNASQRRRDQAYDPFFYGGYGYPRYGYGGGFGYGVGISFSFANSENDIYKYPTLKITFN